MKKALMFVFGLMCAATFAGANNLLVTFSTPGPDKYADGTTVLDGECYALVWTDANGAQETVITAPIAKDGKCPPVLFQLDEAQADGYKNGTWGVYLLDTRVFAEDKVTLASVDKDGNAKVVNTKAEIVDAVAAAAGKLASTKAEGAVAAGDFNLDAVPAPKITAIKMVGANVFVTVADVVPFVGYTLMSASGDNLTDFAVAEGASVAAGTKSEITLVVPKAESESTAILKVTTIK